MGSVVAFYARPLGDGVLGWRLWVSEELWFGFEVFGGG